MKTKSLLALAFVSSVAFISCSDDGSGINVPDDSRENAIAFNVMVPKAPRAASTTTATIKDFMYMPLLQVNHIWSALW